MCARGALIRLHPGVFTVGHDVLARAAGRRGAGKLTALNHPKGRRYSDSDGERRPLALLRQAGLPLPLTQQPLHGWKVDF